MLNTENMNKKMEWYAKILMLFLVIFIPCRNILELYLGTYIKVIPDILILVLMAFFFVCRRGKLEIKSYDIWLLLFLVLAFVNTIIFKKIGLFVYIFEVRSILIYYLLFFVIRNIKFEDKYIMLLSKILRYITYALFLLAVVEKVGNKVFLFPQSVAESIIYADNFARVYSLFFNPNTYGAFLVLSFLFVIYYKKTQDNFVLYKVVVVTSLLLSMSRSSILIFVIGMLAYGIIFKKKEFIKKKFILHVVFVLCISAFLYLGCEKMSEVVGQLTGDMSGIGTNILDRFDALQDDEIIMQSNTDGRIYYIKKGIEIFKAHPLLGTGFGTYGSAASMNWEPPIYEKYQLKYGFYSDNEYIKDLVETGIVGLLLLAAFCFSLIRAYRRKTFSIFIIAVFLWFGLFYNVLEVQIVALLFWGILGFQNQENDLTLRD